MKKLSLYIIIIGIVLPTSFKAATVNANPAVLGQEAPQGQDVTKPDATQDAQALFEESLRRMMPLSDSKADGQIQEYREHPKVFEARENVLFCPFPLHCIRALSAFLLNPAERP